MSHGSAPVAKGRQIYCLSHASRTRTYSPEASERNADATDWLG